MFQTPHINLTSSYEHIKEAYTRAKFLKMLIPAVTSAFTAKGVKNLATSSVNNGAANLGNKVLNGVKNITPATPALKAKANYDIINQFTRNLPVDRRSFLKQRLLDTTFGGTPIGMGTKSIIPLAPSLLTQGIKTVGGTVLN